MNFAYLVAVGVLSLGVVASLVLFPRSRAPRILAAIALVGVSLWCIFGFMAAFEPAETSRLPWLIGFALLGAVCLGGAFMLLRRR
jgi:hypothetical protein